MKRNLILLLCLTAVFLVSNLRAATVTYYQGDGKGTTSSTMGTAIYQTSAGSNYGSAATVNARGYTNDNRYVYVSFPNIFGDEQYQIPEDAIITSATLRLVKTSYDQNSGSGRLYKVTSAWNESTLTWNRRSTYGEGNYSSGYTTFTVNYSEFSSVSINVTSTVQAWANDPSTNYGWMFWCNMTSNQGMTSWATDDHGTASYRPRLTVTYTPLQWQYIKNNKATLSETWTDTQIDALYNLFFARSGNSTINGEKWSFCDFAFNGNGLWGIQHSIGEGWVDKYGFKHIYLGEDRSISTFDSEILGEAWEHIATAGNSALFEESFNADWTKDDLDALYAIYLSHSGQVTLSDGSIWYYTSEDYSQDGYWGSGKNIGDYWVDSKGYKHIFLGSGLTTQNPIPEPISLLLLFMGILSLKVRKNIFKSK